MVRHLKKIEIHNPPEKLVEPSSLTEVQPLVVPAIIMKPIEDLNLASEVKPSIDNVARKTVESETGIKYLGAHVHALEEKLKFVEQRLNVKDVQMAQMDKEKEALERMVKIMQEHFPAPSSSVKEIDPSTVKPAKRSFSILHWSSWIKKGLFYGAALLILIAVFKFSWTVTHLPYQAVMTLKFQEGEVTDKGQMALAITQEVRFAQSYQVKAKVISKILNWPSIITEQGWIMYPVSVFYSHVYDVKHGKEAGTIEVVAQGQDKESVRAVVNQVYEAYRKDYASRRKVKLEQELIRVEAQIKSSKDTLSGIIGQMNKIEPKDHVRGLSKTIKNKVDILANTQALHLEKDVAVLRAQYQALQTSVKVAIETGSLAFMKQRDKGDQAFLSALTLKLTAMEFEKLIIPEDTRESYEAGIKNLKRRISMLISDWAQQAHVVDGQENLLIKTIFINCRYEALNSLLSKGYALTESLVADQLAFHNLEDKMDKELVRIQSLLQIQEKIDRALTQPVEVQVSVKLPVTVFKSQK